ncbi:GIY-YIG nuclease family protein [Paraclostridium sordellii]|uniref:GIY-YIG nuclease family protein n=1 Tax=Paraclostridium sordellii TaxID=1505 RepID=UPI0005E9C34C|nr:GIY-YIG nuclease family protein [Paeniclostridium sordellii]CEN21235.1 excinuclease ABC subunit C [[Clostridium] sordellii] [Paeniclostridium sordellii]
MENCVYRFKDKYNNIIYIGKALELTSRLFNHEKLKSHENIVDTIDFISFDTKPEMDFAEKYYISKYKPKLNVHYIDIENKIMPFEINILDKKEFTEIEGYKQLKDFLNKNFKDKYIEIPLSVDLNEYLMFLGILKFSSYEEYENQYFYDKVCSMGNDFLDKIMMKTYEIFEGYDSLAFDFQLTYKTVDIVKENLILSNFDIKELTINFIKTYKAKIKITY